MSRRSLIAYLATLSLLFAGLVAAVVAKPPDLPVKAEVDCRPEPGKLMTRVYPVADLVIPLCKSPSVAHVALPKDKEQAAPPRPTPPACITHKVIMPAPSACLQEVPPPDPDPPLPHCPCPPGPAASEKTLEDQLIKLITDTVAPQSWDGVGGEGHVEYFPLGLALVVNQTPEVHEQVAELLTALRRLQGAEVAVEVRLISVPEAFYERVGLDFHTQLPPPAPASSPEPCPIAIQKSVCPAPCCSQNRREPQQVAQQFRPFGFVNQFTPGSCPEASVTFLNDREVYLFMEALQGDPRTSIMLAPKMSVFNGQNSSLHVTDQQSFVTSVKTVQADGHSVFVPQNEVVTTGFEISVQPIISADRRFVRLDLEVEQACLDPVVPLFPVTTSITPIFEGGAVGQPVPFTQYLQQPKINTVRMRRAFNVPDGGTALLCGWKKPCTKCTQTTPVLSKIPYINRLFKNVENKVETEQVLVMVTPRIITNEEEELPQVPEMMCLPPYSAEPVPPCVVAQPVPVWVPQPAPPCVAQPMLPPPMMDMTVLAKAIVNELDKREQAHKRYLKAEHYRRKGKTDLAERVFVEVRQDFPESVYAQMATRRLSELQKKVAMREHEAGAEEQEVSPACRRGGDESSCAMDQTSQKQVAKLLDRYCQACSEGRLSDAQKLAVQALAMDPACFCRNCAGKCKANGKSVIPH